MSKRKDKGKEMSFMLFVFYTQCLRLKKSKDIAYVIAEHHGVHLQSHLGG